MTDLVDMLQNSSSFEYQIYCKAISAFSSSHTLFTHITKMFFPENVVHIMEILKPVLNPFSLLSLCRLPIRTEVTTKWPTSLNHTATFSSNAVLAQYKLQRIEVP